MSVRPFVGSLVLLLGAGCSRPHAAAPSVAPAEAREEPRACVAPQSLSTDFYGATDFPSASCRARASELLGKMTLREKLGQMIQLGKDQLDGPGEVTSLALGSVLSGGGAGPEVNSPTNWARMVREYQAASLA